MKNIEETRMLYLASIGLVFRESQNLFFTYKSLKNNIDFLHSKLEWYDPKEGRENKYRMKDLGGLLFQYEESINMTLIFLIEKSIEDIIFQLNKNSKKIDFWEACKTCVFAKEVMTLRHLNNCLKHNNGIIEDTSISGRFLLENGYNINDGIGRLQFDFEGFIYKTYHFNMNLLCQVCNTEFKIIDRVQFFRFLIPEFIHNQL